MGFAQRIVQRIVKIILSFAPIAAITVARRGLTIGGIGFRLIYSLDGIRGTADNQRDNLSKPTVQTTLCGAILASEDGQPLDWLVACGAATTTRLRKAVFNETSQQYPSTRDP